MAKSKVSLKVLGKYDLVPMTGWSPTKLFAWEECPLKMQLQYGQNLCPLCFKGKVEGGFDGKPAKCTKCKGLILKPTALAKGIRIDEAIEASIKTKLGKGEAAKKPQSPDPDVQNKDVLKIIHQVRKEHAAGKVEVQLPIALNWKWEPINYFTKGAWFRGKLDALRRIAEGVMQTLDWKSGGIDKRTNEVRVDKKYESQIGIYNTAVMCSKPEVERVEGALVFVEAPAGKDCIVRCEEMTVDRKNLESFKRRWEARTAPMLLDESFPPRAGWYCGWKDKETGERKGCPFESQKGGPCPY